MLAVSMLIGWLRHRLGQADAGQPVQPALRPAGRVDRRRRRPALEPDHGRALPFRCALSARSRDADATSRQHDLAAFVFNVAFAVRRDQRFAVRVQPAAHPAARRLAGAAGPGRRADRLQPAPVRAVRLCRAADPIIFFGGPLSSANSINTITSSCWASDRAGGRPRSDGSCATSLGESARLSATTWRTG